MWKPFSTLLWQWRRRFTKLLLVFLQLVCDNPCHSYLFNFWRPLNRSEKPMNVILSHVSNCAWLTWLSFPCSSSSPSWLKRFRTRSEFYSAGEFMFVVEALIIDWQKCWQAFQKSKELSSWTCVWEMTRTVRVTGCFSLTPSIRTARRSAAAVGSWDGCFGNLSLCCNWLCCVESCSTCKPVSCFFLFYLHWQMTLKVKEPLLI